MTLPAHRSVPVIYRFPPTDKSFVDVRVPALRAFENVPLLNVMVTLLPDIDVPLILTLFSILDPPTEIVFKIVTDDRVVV